MLTLNTGIPGSEGSDSESDGIGMPGRLKLSETPGIETANVGIPGSDGRLSDSDGIEIPGSAKEHLDKS